MIRTTIALALLCLTAGSVRADDIKPPPPDPREYVLVIRHGQGVATVYWLTKSDCDRLAARVSGSRSLNAVAECFK